MRHLTTWFLAAAATVCSVGCSKQDAAPKPVMVFAAASLTAPFQAIAAELAKAHPDIEVALNFEGTPQLVLKIQQGAPVDVFASADEPNMQKVVQMGKTSGPTRELARNRLAIVVAKDNPKGIRELADLARDDLRVVLCGPEVPAGRYARQALGKASVSVRSRSDEPNVKAIVAKVKLGEVDAGIVYTTDVAAAHGDVVAVAIPDEHNVVATYPIAMLSCGEAPARAYEFIAFALSEPGRQALRAAGFEVP